MYELDVDLGELERLGGVLRRVVDRYSDIGSSADGAARVLAGEWEGVSQESYVAAHAEWISELTTLRDSAAELAQRTVNAVQNYQSAIDANRRLWG